MADMIDRSNTIESDVLSVRAQLRCAFHHLSSLESYGSLEASGGEELCDIGYVMLNAIERLETIRAAIEGHTYQCYQSSFLALLEIEKLNKRVQERSVSPT